MPATSELQRLDCSALLESSESLSADTVAVIDIISVEQKKTLCVIGIKYCRVLWDAAESMISSDKHSDTKRPMLVNLFPCTCSPLYFPRVEEKLVATCDLSGCLEPNRNLGQ